MNEDYLWDKTGSDPEIESFEKALHEFAYRETAPPALPVKVVQFVGKPSRKRFPYMAAAAACLLIAVLVSVGLWLRPSATRSSDALVVDGLAKVENKLPPADLAADPAKVNIEPAIDRTFSVEKTQPKKQARFTAHRTPKQQPEIKLTKEEAFAYDQLKLALSITGSKLKLIKDKVETTDNKKAVGKDGR